MDFTINVQWKRRADNGRVLVSKQFVVKADSATIGGKTVSEAGFAKVLEYGLTQFVADGYAAKKDETVDFDSAREAAESRIEALITGDFSSRTGDGRASHRAAVVKASLANPARAADAKAFAAIDSKAALKWLADYFARQSDEYKAKVEAIVDQRIAAAQASKNAALDI